jgi:hypothetical protein
MSHITGVVVTVAAPIEIGPRTGAAPTAPNTWEVPFIYAPAAQGTKLVILHFRAVDLPASNRLEVDLGYGIDVFTAADGPEFWTRPVNPYAAGESIRVRYVTDGAATGGAQIDRYGRGEPHAGEPEHPSLSNCDPFLKDPVYQEPTYDPWWYCSNPPNWENAACAPNGDVRRRVARSVGMIVSVEGDHVSTCSVTLVDSDKVITAGHCHTPEEALTSSITFDYETDCAGNRPPGYSARFYKVKAVIRHIWDGTHDYSLLQLAEAPTGIPAIQMRPDLPSVGEPIFGVHHPNGAVKKLSVPHPGFVNITGRSATALNVPSSFHVSGGSSGSGLFDTAGRIVGICSHGRPCRGEPLIYYPIASVIREIAPASPPPLTRDVMVVFDRSGSMSELDPGGRPKIDAAKDALSLFVQLVRSNVGNRLGLASFSTTAGLEEPIAPVTPVSKLNLIGAAPFNTGKVGALTPNGSTSIGAGLDTARLQFPGPGGNPRSVLLLTDGMQNTPPLVADVEAGLGGIEVHAIGFGTPANLDGALLTALTGSHNGQYAQAESGLALEKFFSHAFGNIFEAGLLADPEFDLPEDQHAGKTLDFGVCGEDAVTVVVGWDREDADLDYTVRAPNGAAVSAAGAGAEHAAGRTWRFLRFLLPQGGQRDGTWQVTPFRPGGGGEFPAGGPALRYFVNVIPTGGPRLRLLGTRGRYYTGDPINPRIVLRYAEGGWPREAEARVTIASPRAGAGNLLAKAKLGPATDAGGDTIPPRQATLAQLEGEAGGALVTYAEQTVALGQGSGDTEGSFEEASLFGAPMADLLAVEGAYTFRFVSRTGRVAGRPASSSGRCTPRSASTPTTPRRRSSRRGSRPAAKKGARW